MRKRSMKNLISLFLVVLVSMLVFVACQPNATPPVESSGSESEATPQGQPKDDAELDMVAEAPTQTPTLANQDVEEEIVATINPTAPPQVAEESSSEEPEQAAPAEDVAQGPPNHGDQLFATDPATVVLASGDVQLVELFAFW